MFVELSINSTNALLTQIFKEQPLKGKDKNASACLSLPSRWMVEDDGIEPTTPCLQSRCSPSWANPPALYLIARPVAKDWWVWKDLNLRPPPYQDGALTTWATDPRHLLCQPISVDTRELTSFSRKEVIQPHLPIRLPCYDFTPVMNPAVVVALLAVRLTASGKAHSHGVTGGVYKTRERIHRDILIRDY